MSRRPFPFFVFVPMVPAAQLGAFGGWGLGAAHLAPRPCCAPACCGVGCVLLLLPHAVGRARRLPPPARHTCSARPPQACASACVPPPAPCLLMGGCTGQEGAASSRVHAARGARARDAGSQPPCARCCMLLWRHTQHQVQACVAWANCTAARASRRRVRPRRRRGRQHRLTSAPAGLAVGCAALPVLGAFVSNAVWA